METPRGGDRASVAHLVEAEARLRFVLQRDHVILTCLDGPAAAGAHEDLERMIGHDHWVIPLPSDLRRVSSPEDRGDDPRLASYLRIEERRLEEGDLRYRAALPPRLHASRRGYSNAPAAVDHGTATADSPGVRRLGFFE